MSKLTTTTFIGFLVAFSTFAASSPTDFLPIALPWHGASEALIARADNPWITPAERMDLLDSPNYDDTVAYLKKLCAATKLFQLQSFGLTAQGRTLYVVVATREKSFTPAALIAGGKPTLLAQAGIHAGEIDGKDAGLMLLRDIAFGGKAGLLDHANFLFIPIFNADGHERRSEWNRPNQRGPVHQGWRTTAQNLNLNRDYMKADTPEMRALLGLINAWSPSLYFDIHVTDGMDYQYDITYGYLGFDGDNAWSPKSEAWLDRVFHPAIDAALRAAGHIPLNITIEPRDEQDPGKGLDVGRMAPRFSQSYGDLRHLPSILVENHSLKPYRQRVLGTYVLLESTLALLGKEGAALQAAIAADQGSRPASIPVTWAPGGSRPREMDFLGMDSERYDSPASGAKEIRWLGSPKLFPKVPLLGNQPGILIHRPVAYWVPVSKPDVIDRLRVHGIRLEPVTVAKTISVTMYRLVDPQPQPFERAHPYEARNTLKMDVQPETRTETFPAGSVRVPTDQPLGDLAIALLEPQCQDSLAAWGFFSEILKRTEYMESYAIAPMAEKMLAEDPRLKSEFEAKLAADGKFAQNPTARLQWFYQRSKFYDDCYLLYPVGIER
jgi:hypothetical protein